MTVLPKEEATDIVERLNDIWSDDDHQRGCQGRTYSCSCGFDDRTFATAIDAVAEITALRQQLEEARERNLLANERADNAEADVAKARENALEDAVDAVYRVWENGIGRVEVAEAIRALLAPQGKEG